MPAIPAMRLFTGFLLMYGLAVTVSADDPRFPQSLTGTKPLTIKQPLDEVMVAGIRKFCLRELAKSPQRRRKLWNRDFSSRKAYVAGIAENRERLKTYLGVVDPRVKNPRFEIRDGYNFGGGAGYSTTDKFAIHHIRWSVMRGVTAEGLLVQPHGTMTARVVAVPDADWTPEQFCGIDTSKKGVPDRLIRRLAQHGCQIVIPTVINRDDTHSGHPDVGYTNQPHREFIYRMAFEMGRHIIGYEVQKILAAVDTFEYLNRTERKPFTSERRDLPIAVVGVGEGGLLALHAAAVDSRIDAAMVCGYFQSREDVWQEPIYRNVWAQLAEFGDADVAGLIAPRILVIEACAAPEVDGPPAPGRGRRSGAAPGRLRIPDPKAVQREAERAKVPFKKLGAADRLTLYVSGRGNGPAGTDGALRSLFSGIGIEPKRMKSRLGTIKPIVNKYAGDLHDPTKRHERQFRELVRFTQNLLRESARVRDHYWGDAKRTSLADWMKTSRKYRKHVWEELIGRLPDPVMPPNVRTRKVLDKPKFVGYEVVIDVYPDVIAAGILLLPKDLRKGEKRPVVVCQHGLEGVPMDTITETGRGYRYYKAFAAKLAERGFITYAPQNPYRGRDKFRVLQRMSNPLKRSLFSYIIPQHQRTLNWLATLPNVDAKRIAFYGLSYGGKTAVRVPPILVPPQYRDPKANDAPKSPGYCLSICSADFNEWVKKNTSNEDRYSYIFTGEYEIFEWNMGHTANYAELSSLMTPRPFMVERGHGDGVAPDEWVAWEYAKVRRHYVKLGLGDRTEIEFFNGPHTINGKGTFDFLHKHLKWPKPKDAR
ncbi:MAG: alpha/beta hydrolase family protein [Planctomycetaceae bacterium]